MSPYLKAIANDDALPIDKAAVALWVRDLNNPLRWTLRPILQFLLAILLHITWFLKRLPLPQFSAHTALQKMICWFCKNFVTPEANMLILRHYATESNILNFLKSNSDNTDTIAAIELYPQTIDDMLDHSFVDHDQELFRLMSELGATQTACPPKISSDIDWSLWRDIDIDQKVETQRWTQRLDFETSHALFMCMFCFLLTAEEYRDAINGFNLDQSIALRIGKIIGDPSLAELAYNKYPMYLVGPWNLGQRFLMHGFFTEHLHERLLQIRRQSECRHQA